MTDQTSGTLLHVTTGYGDHKLYLNGRRITKARYEDLWDRAEHRDSLTTTRKKGAWYFYTEIR